MPSCSALPCASHSGLRALADPASHSARTVAALTDVALDGLPMTDVDRTEAAALADAAGDEAESFGAWMTGERAPA